MAQVLDLWSTECTLFNVGIKLIFYQSLENSFQMLYMGCKVLVIHQDIVKKYQHKFSQEPFEYLIHQGLKCCWSICEAKQHYQELVMPFMSSKSRLMFILLNSNLVVAHPQVQF